MKFIIDKVAETHTHALSISEVKALLRSVPPDWLRSIQAVHLKSSLPECSCFDPPVIYSSYSSRLNICSVGLDPQEARKEVLRELAVNGLRIRTRSGHRLSKADLAKVDKAIAPFLAKFDSADASEKEEEALSMGLIGESVKNL